MRKVLIAILLVCGISFAQRDGITTTEYLDHARDLLKKAYEAGAHMKAPYEFSKASSYYNIAKETASDFKLENAVEAAKKSIEWSLKALEKSAKEDKR